MLKQEVHRWFQKLFTRGANADVQKDLLGEGYYVNAQNMRVTSVDGHSGSMEKISGEELEFSPEADELVSADTYVCIGACVVGAHQVSFWASTQGGLPVIIKVDGVTMVKSTAIPYRWDRPLQFGEVSRCQGGVVFPADGESDPLFWDIPAVIDAYDNNSTQFTTGFNLSTVLVGLSAPAEWPRFTALLNTGQGLPAGQYIYRLRGVYSSGDRTNFGPESPPISVPLVQDADPNTSYPGGRTTGGQTTIDLIPTPYAIQVQFRVDNLQNLPFIEVCRRRFNAGQGLNGPGIDEVVGRISIGPGELSVITWVDPVDANFLEVIPPDQAQQQFVAFTAPKTVEHIDNRVVYGNFRKADRLPTDVTFRRIEGRTMFPFTKKVTSIVNGQEVNDGYSNPLNRTYLPSYMRGEKYGFGVAFWDGFSTKSFVKPVEDAENLQMPNRRDIKGSLGNFGNVSRQYSDDLCLAATVEVTNGPTGVAPTFEAFTQGQRIKAGTEGVNVMASQGPYRPWRPRDPNDSSQGYEFKPTNFRLPIYDSDIGANPDTGALWAPRYHALGVALSGVQNIPSWARVLTVCRTEPAGRVIAQGLASYDIEANLQSSDLPAGKSTNRWRWWSKDVHASVVPEAVWNDVQQNPRNYSLQAVSPLGFYSEIYGYWRNTGNVPGTVYGARALDMLTYAGVQRDEGQVNAGEPIAGNMGFNGAGNAASPFGNWVGFGRWRSSDTSANPLLPNYNYWEEQGTRGNALIPLDEVDPVTEGRASFWRLRCDPSIYSPQGGSTTDGSVRQRDFGNPWVRRFHQPFYAVNVVRDAASVRDLNIQNYIQVQHVHLASCIGVITDEATQIFTLLNERMDDVRPRFLGDIRYVWIQTPNGDEQAWVCVFGPTTVNGNEVLADIAANGFWLSPDGIQVYGIYVAFTSATGERIVRFGLWGVGQVPIPEEGSRILVKYDDRAPIEVFGGDVTISPACHTVIDGTSNGLTEEGLADIGGLPLPYPGFRRNAEWILPRTGSTPDLLTVTDIRRIESIRQWAILWDAESRVPGNFDRFDPLQSESFPRQHYKARPYSFDASADAAANGFYPDYDSDYPNEWTQWAFGGIPASNINGVGSQKYNLNYAKQPTITFLGLPRNGVDPRLDYCTGLIASLRLDPQQQDTPGLRTFLEENIMMLSEENGEIKKILALDQGGYQQLWSWEEKGLCRVPYNKNMLVGASGEAIGTQSISNFWPREEVWVTRGAKGMPDQLWRCSTKANAPVGQGDIDTAFWVDRVSAYQLVGGQVIDIARNKYLSVLQPILKGTPGGYEKGYASIYNAKNGEWWISLMESIPGQNLPGSIFAPPRLLNRLLVFSGVNREWVGSFTYQFDQYLAKDSEVYGYRTLQGYELDKGELIAGSPVYAWAETAFAPYPSMRSELVSWRVAPDKPTEIRVYDRDHSLMLTTSEAINGPLWVKFVDSYQQLMGRTDASYDPARRRVQDTLFFMRVYHADPSRFVLTFAQTQAKQIA